MRLQQQHHLYKRTGRWMPNGARQSFRICVAGKATRPTAASAPAHSAQGAAAISAQHARCPAGSIDTRGAFGIWRMQHHMGGVEAPRSQCHLRFCLPGPAPFRRIVPSPGCRAPRQLLAPFASRVVARRAWCESITMGAPPARFRNECKQKRRPGAKASVVFSILLLGFASIHCAEE